MTADDLLVALSRHIGAARGITAQRLAAILGVNARQVRIGISALRENGADPDNPTPPTAAEREAAGQWRLF